MDNIDLKIKQILSIKLQKPKSFSDIIDKSLNKSKYKTIKAVNKITKIAATIIIGTGITVGVAYAGTVIYDKIWKEPKAYTYQEIIDELPPQEVLEEEKQKLITEEEAKKKALEVLEILGYTERNINRIELKRGYSSKEEQTSYYMAKTKYGYEEGLMVLINSKNGEFLYFNDLDLKYKHLKSDNITIEEATNIAKEIYSKIGLEEGEYELTKIEEQENYFENKENKIWGANFYKKYNGIENKYESFTVGFIAVNGNILIDTINLNKDDSFQKNPIILTEEEAINIVKNKEKEFSSKEIIKITSKLSIEKMNAFIYQLENNKYDVENTTMETEIYYKTEDVSRIVWKIKVEHEKDNELRKNEYNKYIKEGMNKIYFVDATTGEIIGGEQAEFATNDF